MRVGTLRHHVGDRSFSVGCLTLYARQSAATHQFMERHTLVTSVNAQSQAKTTLCRMLEVGVMVKLQQEDDSFLQTALPSRQSNLQIKRAWRRCQYARIEEVSNV